MDWNIGQSNLIQAILSMAHPFQLYCIYYVYIHTILLLIGQIYQINQIPIIVQR